MLVHMYGPAKLSSGAKEGPRRGGVWPLAFSLDPTKLPCMHMVTKEPAYAHSIRNMECGLCGRYYKKQHVLLSLL